MNKIRALSVDIYESKNIGNCSNNGISNRFRTAYIICPDGNWEFDLDDPENLPENLVKQSRNIILLEHLHMPSRLCILVDGG